ncbi:MAG: DEAD/DEAH box helicase, partial [Myxococcales bacterium]|nr:DEAD/DEAH box helicase [Myxococcales bacterium]
MTFSFQAATQRWLDSAFAAPTEVQARGWPRIAAGDHALLIAPTGSGKTLAAFLYCIDQLTRPAADGTIGGDGAAASNADADAATGFRVVYVSPLKALVYDIERNLRAPLRGIEHMAQQLETKVRIPRVSVRTGDTTQRERREMARDPGEILVTTPESLYLLLGSQARANFKTVTTVIVDEVHALAPSKRGVHLSLSLERLAELCDADPQRIGLSATASPLAEVARFLGGDRPVQVIDASRPPLLDLEIVVPVMDMTQPSLGAHASASDGDGGEGHGDSGASGG